jgi:hypothetical protein
VHHVLKHLSTICDFLYYAETKFSSPDTFFDNKHESTRRPLHLTDGKSEGKSMIILAISLRARTSAFHSESPVPLKLLNGQFMIT